MHRSYMKTISGIILLVVTGILLSCSGGDDGGGTTEPEPFDAEATMAEAWNDFEAGLYEDAEEKFTEVIEHDSEDADAFLGRGWSKAFQSEFSSAVTDFLEALEQGHADYDADMGVAASYRDLPNYEGAINYAKTVINNRPQYSFSRKPSIDYLDAHLIIAQSHFRLGGSHYSLAHEKINYLCKIEGLDTIPEYGTLPAEDYEKLLAETLEELTEIIGD